MGRKLLTLPIGLLACDLMLSLRPTLGQSGAGLYAGKTVQLISTSGGVSNNLGQTIARHLGKHLSGNPTVVHQNDPDLNRSKVAHFIFNNAPKDGTVLGLIDDSAALAPLERIAGTKPFDPTQLSWIGTPSKETSVCVASPFAPIKTAQDLFEKKMILGSTGLAENQSYPKALKELLGMKFLVVSGFPYQSDLRLAMENREIDGICTNLNHITTERREKKVVILFQGSAYPNSDLEGAPFIFDFARTNEQKLSIYFLYAKLGIGYPIIAPPHLSADRLKMLRTAFDATMKDPNFIADVKKVFGNLEPTDGERLAAVITKLYATPKPIIEKIKQLTKY